MTPTPDPVVTASGRGRVAALTLDDPDAPEPWVPRAQRIVGALGGRGERWGTVEALRTVLPQWLTAGWRFTRPAHPDLDAAGGP